MYFLLQVCCTHCNGNNSSQNVKNCWFRKMHFGVKFVLQNNIFSPPHSLPPPPPRGISYLWVSTKKLFPFQEFLYSQNRLSLNTCIIGYNDFDFFINKTDSLRPENVKWDYETHLWNMFFVLLNRFIRVWQKVLKQAKFFFAKIRHRYHKCKILCWVSIRWIKCRTFTPKRYRPKKFAHSN